MSQHFEFRVVACNPDGTPRWVAAQPTTHEPTARADLAYQAERLSGEVVRLQRRRYVPWEDVE